MTAERWTRAVGRRGGPDRPLPLGTARDGAWITEGAAGSALRRAAEGVHGVRLDELRIALADPEDAVEPAVPPPPGALPPGLLRIGAGFAVVTHPLAPDAEALPATAGRLRAILTRAAVEDLGLAVTEVDLRVTALLDEDPPGVRSAGPTPAQRPEPSLGPDESAVAAAVRAVPGVVRLSGAAGVHLEERLIDAALPRRHVRVELAVAADRRAVDVARAVRGAVTEALLDHPSVAVLVTAVVP